MYKNLLADIITTQLGGNKFIAMTGAVLSPTYNGLSIHLPKLAKDGIRKININYKNDLYDVFFVSSRGGQEKTVKEFKNVFNFELLKLIENHTGLITSI